MKTKFLLVIFVILIISILGKKTNAQNFVGGIEAGPIVSQYYGDGYSGYNKLSYKAGFFVARENRKQLSYQFELYYIQKGSHYVSEDNSTEFNLRLRYIELPVTGKYLIKGIHIPGLLDTRFKNKVHLNLGLSYAYLIQGNEDTGEGWQDATPYYYSYDMSWHFGFDIYLTNNFFIDLRFSHSFLPIRNYAKNPNKLIQLRHLNRNLQLTLAYQF